MSCIMTFHGIILYHTIVIYESLKHIYCCAAVHNKLQYYSKLLFTLCQIMINESESYITRFHFVAPCTRAP